MSNKESRQVLKLDKTQYSSELEKARTETKRSFQDMNNSLVGSSKQFKQNEDQVYRWGKVVGQEFAKAKKSFTENLGTGLKASALAFGAATIKEAATDAVALGFKFSKTFAEIRSMTGASEKDLKNWNKEFREIGKRTGADIDNLSESFRGLFTSVKDPKELMKIMNLLGDTSSLTSGKSTELGAFAESQLRDQGRDVTQSSVSDVLSAADLVRRQSRGINTMEQAMQALSKISGKDIKASGLSQREVANIVAATTRVQGVNAQTGVDLVSKLMNISSNPLMQGSILGGVLRGADLKDASGKFDLSRINTQAARSQLQNLGRTEQEQMEVFSTMASDAGFSREQSDALFSMIMQQDEFTVALKTAAADVKQLGQSSLEAGDNIQTSWAKFTTTLVDGFMDIFGPLEKPIKSILNGDIMKGLGETPDALSGMFKGVLDHPALTASSLGAATAGGAMINGILGKLGLGAASGGGAAAGGSRILSMLNPVTKVLGAGMAGYTAGQILNDKVIDPYTTETNQYGQTSNIVERGIAATSVGLGQMFPFTQKYGALTEAQYKEMYEPKKQEVEVKVVIESNDPAFSAKPKASDNVRDARTQ